MDHVKYLLALSCVIPAAIGLLKFKRVGANYLPFILMMTMDVIIELVNLFTQEYKFVNIYMLLNFSLFLFFVQKNKYISKFLTGLLFTMAFSFFIWNCFYNGMISIPSYSQLCFVSASMLFVFIWILSKQITAIKSKLWDNFWFWLSSAYVLYNANLLLLFSLYNFAMDKTLSGKVVIEHIWPYVNAGSYCILAIAMVKMPDKRKVRRYGLVNPNLHEYAV